MAEYNIGPGQTYETFAALEAAVVLAGDDIVDGGNNPFVEIWTPQTSGTEGNVITLQNAYIAIGAGGIRNLDINGKSYITVDSIDFDGGTGQGVILRGAGSNNTLTDFTILNTAENASQVALNVADQTAFTISSGTINQGLIGSFGLLLSGTAAGDIVSLTISNAGAQGAVLSTSGAVAVTSLTTINSASYGFYKTGSGALTGGAIICDGTVDANSSAIRIEDGTINVTELQGLNSTLYGVHFDVMATDIEINEIYAGQGKGNAATTDGNVDSGVYFKGCTGKIAVGKIVVRYNSGDGLLFSGAATLDADSLIQNVYASNNDRHGIDVMGGKAPTIHNFTSNHNGEDGYAANDGTTESVLYKGELSYNGTLDSTNSGDGLTSHLTATGVLGSFLVMRENFKAAVAWASSGAGNKIYHITSINNQKQYEHGEFYTTANSPSTPHELKNSILCNFEGKRIGKLVLANDFTLASNVYLSNIDPTAAPFSIAEVDKTWAEFVAENGDTTSIFIHKDGTSYKVYLGSAPTVLSETLDYCPIKSTGEPVNRTGNPILTMNLIIDGVNNIGQEDIRGRKVYGLPIPGCYQGVDIPRLGGGNSLFWLNKI